MGCGWRRHVTKVLFVLQMLSKVSVDQVFMHSFEKMSSALWTLPVFCPWIPLGVGSVIQIRSLPSRAAGADDMMMVCNIPRVCVCLWCFVTLYAADILSCADISALNIDALTNDFLKT